MNSVTLIKNDQDFRQMIEMKKQERANERPAEAIAREQAWQAQHEGQERMLAPEVLEMRRHVFGARSVTTRNITSSDAVVDSTEYTCSLCFGCYVSSVSSLVCGEVHVSCNDHVPCVECNARTSCCRNLVTFHAPPWVGLVCCVPLQFWLVLCAASACYSCGHEVSSEPQLTSIRQCWPLARVEHVREVVSRDQI
jgi:hypothetical protein